MFTGWKDVNTIYTVNGTYHNLDFYAALIPELRLGKARRFALLGRRRGYFCPPGQIQRHVIAPEALNPTCSK